MASIAQLMTRLRDTLDKQTMDGGKNVELLLLSAAAARQMNGVCSTSCKSAKDRTSMLQTWEHATATIHLGLGDDGFESLVDRMRGPDGVRLHNAASNTGKPAYAFNQIQQKALPPELRPPAGTTSAKVKS